MRGQIVQCGRMPDVVAVGVEIDVALKQLAASTADC